MSASTLDSGWRTVRFGDIVSNVNENTKEPTSIGIDRVVGLDHLDPESLPLRRWDYLGDLPDGTSFTRIFRSGQVLFGKRRAYQRKVAVPDFDGICSGDILVFESAGSDLLPAFLPYLVQSDGFFDQHSHVCDTRTGNPSYLSGGAAQCSGQTFSGSGTLSVALSGTGVPLPSNATAVVANVTAIDSAGSGTASTLVVYAAGSSQPNTSNLTAAGGTTVNNQVTVGLGTNSSGAKGIVIANTSGTVDVQVDVEGYYTGGEAGQGFVSVAPTRVCDTRASNPSGLSGVLAQCNGSGNHGSPIGAGATKSITVAGTGFPSWSGWVPSAAVVDITAVNPTATTSLTAYRNSQGRPATTSLSAAAGTTVDKEVVVGLGSSSGAFMLYNAAGSTDVTVDLLGYFYSAAGNGTPLYVPLKSQRLCDSRSGNPSSLSSPYDQCNGTGSAGETIGAGGSLTLQVGGIDSVPQTPFSVTVNVTALNETTAGGLVVYPSTAARPNVTTLSYSAGQVSSNPDTVSTSGGYITIYNTSGSTDVTVDLVGYYVLPDPIATTFAYNGDGLRSSVTTSMTNETTYDSTGTIPQVLEDGTNAYLYGPSGEVFEQVSNGGSPDYLVQDQIGSTRALTDQSGSVVATYNFGSLGNLISETGTLTTPIGFASAYTDSTTGLVYLIHRYYDPYTDEMLSPDPLVMQTSQPYSYASNNPLNGSDPTGQSSVWLPGVAQWAVANANGTYNGFRDDCTDFVSRALVIGGGSQESYSANFLWDVKNKRNLYMWFQVQDYLGFVATSKTWANAGALALHFCGNGSVFLPYIGDAVPGDIIFASWRDSDFYHISHAAVITAMYGALPFFTQHTPTQINYPLTYWFQKNPHASVWIARPASG